MSVTELPNILPGLVREILKSLCKKNHDYL